MSPLGLCHLNLSWLGCINHQLKALFIISQIMSENRGTGLLTKSRFATKKRSPIDFTFHGNKLTPFTNHRNNFCVWNSNMTSLNLINCSVNYTASNEDGANYFSSLSNGNCKDEALGFLANFWSVFRFLYQKISLFRLSFYCGLSIFCLLTFGFRFASKKY